MKLLISENKQIARTIDQISKIRPEEDERLTENYGTWKVCLKTNELMLSPETKNLLGLRCEWDYSLRQLVRHIDPGSFENAKHWLRRLGTRGILEPLRLKIYTTSKAAIWVKLSWFHYSDNRGNPALILGVIQNCAKDVYEERISLSCLKHEIRTPLSVMKLSAQLIQRGHDQSKISYADLARKIEHQVEGITKLLDQYLSDTGDSHLPQRLNLSVFDLNNLIHQVVSDLAAIHCQHMFIHENEGLRMVRADRSLICQVLINYLTNAVKYSPINTAIKVDVRVCERTIVVAVTDQGQGIPAGLEKRVFERFFRCNQQCEKNVTGMGLGLYLVKQIIERHKGSVWMEKDSVKGSRFFFSLPFYGQ